MEHNTLRSVWWLNPLCIYMILMLLVVYAWQMPHASYRSLYGVYSKDINAFYVSIYAISAILFYVGIRRSKPVRFVPVKQCVKIEKTYRVLLILTIVAYVVWFVGFFMAHGVTGLLAILNSSVLNENMYIFRNESGRISGLTTMTELGVIVTPLSFMLYKYTQKKSIDGI